MKSKLMLLVVFIMGGCLAMPALPAPAQDFNVLFKGTELVNSRGDRQGAEVAGRGYITWDTTIDMLSAGTYNIRTLWAGSNPRNLYGTVTVDANGDVTAVTGALVIHGPKTVGFDTTQLTAVNVLLSQVARGVQNVLILHINGFHSQDTVFYLPDGTYYPATGHVPGHPYYGTFTVGGGGVSATTGACTNPNPGEVGFDVTQLTEVVVRGDLFETANGIPMQFSVQGIGVINRGSIFGAITYYLPDATYRLETGWAPGHLDIGTFTVAGGSLTATTGAGLINVAGQIEVDQSQLNAVKVTPIDSFRRWAINEQTQGFQDSNTVDTVSLPNGTFSVIIQLHDHSYVYGAFNVTDGVLSETLLPVGAPLVELSTNTDPVADAGLDQELECENADGASVMLVGLGSSDPDGDDLEYQWSVPAGITLDDPTSATPTGTFPPGITLATLTVTDGRGGVDVDDVQISVVDTTPPEVACTTDVALLWPPNHRMEVVEVYVDATDNCASPGDLILLEVTVISSEPDDADGNGDGETTGDVDFADGFTAPVDITNSFSFNATTGSFEGMVALRAERDGAGTGRSYTISAKVVDTANNLATTSCVVVVPHDRRGKNN